MSSISVEMWRARIGGFSSSFRGMKRPHRMRTNSSYKRSSMIIVLILSCVCLTSSNPLTSRKHHNTTNYCDINENSTPGTSYGTTINFETMPFFNVAFGLPIALCMSFTFVNWSEMQWYKLRSQVLMNQAEQDSHLDTLNST